jgi:predicted lipoprotein with Yx(FWY)xxD motif
MRHPLSLTAAASAAALLLAACGSSSNSTTTSSSAQPSTQASSSAPATVKTASSSQGTILVDAQGMTLYHLSAEKNGKFICTNSACTAIWHPVTVTAGATPSGVSSLSTVKRPDGTTQVTYNGSPLYTFAQDQAPGQTNGQGIKDVGTWTVVTTGAAGSSAGTTSTQSSPPASSGGGGGGGYAY